MRSAHVSGHCIAIVPDLHLALIPSPEAVSEARRAVERFAFAAGAERQTVEDARLAVSEAATNVVLHAEASRIVVHASCECGRVQVVVSDDGGGLRGRDDSPGLGLGLGIIALCAEHFDIGQPSAGGSTMRMTFPLPARGVLGAGARHAHSR